MKTKLITIFFVFFVLVGANANAFEYVGPGKITYLENGWFGEGVALHLDKGTSGCPAMDIDFGIPSDHPSFKEMTALATSAFLASANVELVVDVGNCVFGSRTKILAIRLLK